MHELTTARVLEFAERYRDLGEAVTRQVRPLLRGEFEELNPAAVELIADRLGGYLEDLDDALEDWRDRVDE